MIHFQDSSCHCPNLEATVAATLQSQVFLEREIGPCFQWQRDLGSRLELPQHRRILSAAEKPPDGNELGRLPW